MPDCAVCRWSTGTAIASSTAADPAAAITGWRSAGVSSFDHTRFSPLGRRSRPRNGMRPFSTRSPSFDRSAGSTVSEPSIAIATTMIVPTPNERKVRSPEKNSPAIAAMTVSRR